MSDKLINPAGLIGKKEQLVELISTLKEQESLQLLQELHDYGIDAADLLSLCMEGVRRVGLRFEQGKYYISALIMAGEIMKQTSEYLSSFLQPNSDDNVKGTVLLGTVQGDIHDLGKNILKDMLTCNGFKVVDLGVDVPVETFSEKYVEVRPDFVAISCLLTQCLDNLAETVNLVKDNNTESESCILIGGSCVDEVINEYIKADRWFNDAIKAVAFCREKISNQA